MQNLRISNPKGVSGALALGTLLLLLGGPSLGSAPVVDAQPSVDRENRPVMLPPARQGQQRGADRGDQPVTTQPFRPPVLEDEDAPGGESASELRTQLRQLQQEVMSLRGMVESQQHAIARLERQQRERYLDLDRRLSRMGGGPAMVPEGPGAGLVDEAAAAEDTSRAGDDERAAYERAFRLTREREFEAALQAFRNFIDDYPGEALEGNAWYWLGELYLVIDDPDLEASREAFVQVKERWPEHDKVPDVLYKLGVVYHQLGESGQARDYLQQVQQQHPDSSAARLAGNYLERL